MKTAEEILEEVSTKNDGWYEMFTKETTLKAMKAYADQLAPKLVRLDEQLTKPEEILKKYNPDVSPYLHEDDCIGAMEEYAEQFKPKWIPVSEIPKEGGRFWCYLEEINDLGISHYQWNCSYHEIHGWQGTEGNRVTHYTPLLEPPENL